MEATHPVTVKNDSLKGAPIIPFSIEMQESEINTTFKGTFPLIPGIIPITSQEYHISAKVKKKAVCQ